MKINLFIYLFDAFSSDFLGRKSKEVRKMREVFLLQHQLPERRLAATQTHLCTAEEIKRKRKENNREEGKETKELIHQKEEDKETR